MTEQTLEIEIENASRRIETRQGEIDIELGQLITQIDRYTTWAWRFVWFGAAIGVLSTLFFLCKNNDSGFGLNLLGDFMAGTVASIWSLAGLFFIYVAFLGQKQQLLNQQLEIMYSQLEVKYTRLELSGQKEEMMLQNKTLRQQKFENTFFQLLTLFSSIVNSLDLRKSRSSTEVISTGRDCFEIFYKRLVIFLTNRNQHTAGYKKENATLDEVILAYEDLYNNDKSDMSHYFRTIYHIVKFVDTSDIENKKQYIAIARAQLSSYEQILIFYNCLHENGSEKFKPLIEKYSLFKNIDGSLLINKDHLTEYENGAYGR
ncbi:putative phage abortive infection protein [Flavobacterium aurantiibacter]|nr:putative phage abortive infection protein [Flavobacterium aurantiibacter]